MNGEIKVIEMCDSKHKENRLKGGTGKGEVVGNGKGVLLYERERIRGRIQYNKLTSKSSNKNTER